MASETRFAAQRSVLQSARSGRRNATRGGGGVSRAHACGGRECARAGAVKSESDRLLHGVPNTSRCGAKGVANWRRNGRSSR